jgi:transposase
MRENITLDREQQKRLYILNQVIEGKLVARQAAELMNRSIRQIRRMVADYRNRGATAVVHGNRGRRPVNRIAAKVASRVVKLAQAKYSGFNQQHFSELLAEREGIRLSRASVRRILGRAGIRSPRQRRVPAHRSRRQRYVQEGMLVQIDGSPHRWLGRARGQFSLLAAIDDATGKVLGAVFRRHEDAQGYFLLLRGIVEAYGCPLAVYRDRHGIFQRGKKRDLTIPEQLEDQPNQTQFGRLLSELGMESIPSHSPQAKGRIERLFGTFQDRLVNELRLAEASSMDEATALLAEFLPRYNRRFAVAPQQPGTVYQQPPSGRHLDEIFCFKYRRTVGMDNTVRFYEHRIQIHPDRQRTSYARGRVEVHERMDGSVAVYFSGRCLTTTEAPAEAPVLRVRENRPIRQPTNNRRHETKPARKVIKVASRKPTPKHPWRRMMNLWSNRSFGVWERP